MTFFGSERGTGSATACRFPGRMGAVCEEVVVFTRPLLGMVDVCEEVDVFTRPLLGMVGVCEEVDVEARGILFTYGSTYLE